MTVREHMKAAGFDPLLSDVHFGEGFAECEKISLEVSHGSDDYGKLLIVTVTAIVPWSDGTMKPYPSGWGGLEKGLKMTAYFKEEVMTDGKGAVLAEKR